LLDKTVHSFSTSIQNFKWFRKCCRTKNSSAKLLIFFQSTGDIAITPDMAQ
jgi:hypothetical protein